MNPLLNPYLQFADSIKVRRRRITPRVVQSDSQAPKVPTAAEREIRESNTQLRRYYRWKALELKKLLDGEVGEEIRALRKLLRDLAPGYGEIELLQFMENHGWFLNLDRGSRRAILDLIDGAMMRMRVREGLAPIDDSLPEHEPTTFEICRTNLEVDR